MVDVTATPAYDIELELVAFRRYIVRQRRVRYAIFTALALAMLWTVAAALYYFAISIPALVPLGLSIALIIGAVVAEFMRRPSLAATAAALDSRLDNIDRVTTAIELLDAASRSELAEKQLDSTRQMLASVEPRRVFHQRQPWAALWLALALVFLAAGLVLLKNAQPGAAAVQAGILPPEPALASGGLATPTTGVDLTQNLSEQMSDSAAAQQALERLARALDELSATHQAAVSLRQHAYDLAAQQVSDVGDASDQLSSDARDILANALSGAATDSAALPLLQKAEQDSAFAIQGGAYRTMVDSLHRLAQAILDTARKVINQEDLAQALATPSAEATEEAGAASNTSGAAQPTAAPNTDQASGAASGNQAVGDQPASATTPAAVVATQVAGVTEASDIPQQVRDEAANSPPDPNSTPSTGGQPDSVLSPDGGNQEGAGGGSSAGNAPSRVTGAADTTDLDVEGNPFELEGKPGPGETTADDSNQPPALTMEGTGKASGAGASVVGSGEAPPGEVNRAPVDRREVVRSYFDPTKK